MSKVEKFNMQMNYKYDYLEKISIADTISGNENVWFNQTLCKVNSSVLRVGVFTKGEFPLHKHDNDDEVFFVIKGNIVIETENGNFELGEGEGVCVPKGVMHHPVVEETAIVLMIENDGIDPFGNK